MRSERTVKMYLCKAVRLTLNQRKVKRKSKEELTGPTKPSSEVLVKGRPLIGIPDGVTGTVCKKIKHY